MLFIFLGIRFRGVLPYTITLPSLPTLDVYETIHSLIEVAARLDDDPVHGKLESALAIVSQKRTRR